MPLRRAREPVHRQPERDESRPMARGRFTSVLGLQSARCAGGAPRDGRLRRLQPLMRVALLATAGVLFAFQRRRILAEPLVRVLIAVPILIQVYFNGGLG